MTAAKKFTVFGFVSGIASGDEGCGAGPLVLQQSVFLQPLVAKGSIEWRSLFFPVPGDDKVERVAEITQRLAIAVQQCLLEQRLFLVLGGDHSSAIGTWSGASYLLRPKGPIGLVWIDAHLDSHTFATTETGNIHGMPLAALLGHGEARFTQLMGPQPKLLPTKTCVIGVRSYEVGEAALLRRLGVRIYEMEEIKQRGMAAVWQEALAIVKSGTAGYGISLDLDSVDPKQAPGVGNPEKGGLDAAALTKVLYGIAEDPQLLGVEIVEFNPERDQKQRTEKLVSVLVEAMLVSFT